MEPLAAFLERQAGHVCIAFGLIGAGAVLHWAGIPKAEDVLPFALGVLARSMTGKKTDPAGAPETKQ